MIHEYWLDEVRKKLGSGYTVDKFGHVYRAVERPNADKPRTFWQFVAGTSNVNPDNNEIGRAFEDGRIEVYDRGFAKYCDKQGFDPVQLVPEGTWGHPDW